MSSDDSDFDSDSASADLQENNYSHDEIIPSEDDATYPADRSDKDTVPLLETAL